MPHLLKKFTAALKLTAASLASAHRLGPWLPHFNLRPQQSMVLVFYIDCWGQQRSCWSHQWLLYKIPAEFSDRETSELIWMPKIKEKPSHNMNIKDSEDRTHYFNSSTTISRSIFSKNNWHLIVSRKFNSPSMGGLPVAPDTLISTRSFSWF